ncbi:hypothetical protein P4C99_10020 [Pontiellaceae bacterium B1224]|nr:hypothetical protein [Pontiellaceae bacterium B1224]
MKKASCCLIVIGLMVSGAHAQTIVFDNGGGNTLTTGDFLDEVPEAGLTTNVIEISGLNITARPGSGGQKINTTTTSLGVTIYNSGDDADRFDSGEVMILSFDKKVEITELDMVGFESNSVFTINIDGLMPINIEYDDLINKSSQHFVTNLIVEANTDIQFYVGNSNSVIGLQSMDVSVIELIGELYLSLEKSNSVAIVSADFDGVTSSGFVMQVSTNLASNVWNTVSGEFNSDTNMNFNATNNVQYFRAVIP